MERAAQIGASIALECADLSRKDRETYTYWIDVARAANDRTRASMIERDVDLFPSANRRGIGA